MYFVFYVLLVGVNKGRRWWWRWLAYSICTFCRPMASYAL